MATNTVSNTLGKDEFLRLFTTQLRYQDPLKPMDGTEFTAQLAQFSSLEQLTNVNTNLTAMMMYEKSLNSVMAVSFIGKTVRSQDGDTGKITGVNFTDGVTYLLLDSGKKITLGQIQEIT